MAATTCETMSDEPEKITVAKLIEVLKDFPQDAIVRVNGEYSHGWECSVRAFEMTANDLFLWDCKADGVKYLDILRD